MGLPAVEFEAYIAIEMRGGAIFFAADHAGAHFDHRIFGIFGLIGIGGTF
jgi:hypothetical protein